MNHKELKDVFAAVLVISLKNRADRRRALLKNLKACRWPFKKPTFVEAVSLDRCKLPGNWLDFPGAYAGVRSHLKAAQLALQHHKRGGLVMVLEDDAEFPKDFAERFMKFVSDIPDDWDCLMPGWIPAGVNVWRINNRVCKARFVWGLHCYIMRQPMLDAWIEALEKNHCSGDQTISSLMARFHVYVPNESLCQQAIGTSDIDPRKAAKPKTKDVFCAELPQSRMEFGNLLGQLKLDGAGLEIGVKDGKYSHHLVKHSGLSKIYLLDAWKHFPESDYEDGANDSQKVQDARYRQVLKQMKPYGKRVQVLRGDSRKLHKKFADGSLDFVFIDANHSYDAVLEDLRNFAPKVRRGGIVSGHDFANQVRPGSVIEVKRAVEDYCRERGIELHITPEPWPSWWFLKT